MDLNANILLPHDSYCHDVANVIGVLSGLRIVRRTNASYTYLEVPGVEVSQGYFFEGARIDIRGRLVDRETRHSVTFFFEDSRNPDFSRLLMPKSTPYWLAIGKGLISFFGGILIYNDDPANGFIHVPKWREHYNREDMKENCARQNELFSISPLKSEDLDAMSPFAALSDDCRW